MGKKKQRDKREEKKVLHINRAFVNIRFGSARRPLYPRKNIDFYIRDENMRLVLNPDRLVRVI